MQNQPSSTVLSDQTVSVLLENSSDSPFQDLTDTLLAQVLAHHSIITVFGCWIADVVTCRIQNYNWFFCPVSTNNLLFLALNSRVLRRVVMFDGASRLCFDSGHTCGWRRESGGRVVIGAGIPWLYALLSSKSCWFVIRPLDSCDFLFFRLSFDFRYNQLMELAGRWKRDTEDNLSFQLWNLLNLL